VGTAAVLLLTLATSLQAGKGTAAADPAQIDEAIRKGVAYLKMQSSPASEHSRNSHELILLAFAHAGIPETDPVFEKLFQEVLSAELARTYNVALQAVLLEELDRVKYQKRIFECAQFLVDNQCKNGQWLYGEPIALPTLPTGRKIKPVSPGTKKKSADARPKPPVVLELPVRKMREGPPTGCNSNSQYAALGLRACAEAGILLPAETIALARKSWLDSQNADGGWTYGGKGSAVSYGAMTAGGVASLAIYEHLLRKDWRKEPAVQSGMAWLGDHFTVTSHGPSPWGGYLARHYYLYALERAGLLAGTETFGTHAWYAEGAKALLASQTSEGSWNVGDWDGKQPVWDTCFAILYLRRATRPLTDVASMDRVLRKE
jgi:hypothetical protein